jgi:hypothetical protein
MIRMILRDKPESASIPLPADNLTDEQRLSRLFSGIEGRWRLLAVLTLKSGPSDLLKPELLELARRFGPRGLVIRLVFIGDSDLAMLDRELSRWSEENIVVTGDNIHARRLFEMSGDCMPCLRLFSPAGELKAHLTGFDTDEGLDSLARILEDEIADESMLIPDDDVLSEGLSRI